VYLQPEAFVLDLEIVMSNKEPVVLINTDRTTILYYRPFGETIVTVSSRSKRRLEPFLPDIKKLPGVVKAEFKNDEGTDFLVIKLRPCEISDERFVAFYGKLRELLRRRHPHRHH